MLKTESFELGESVAFPVRNGMDELKWEWGVVCDTSKEGQVTVRMDEDPKKERKSASPRNEDCADWEEVQKIGKACVKFKNWLDGFADSFVLDQEERELLKLVGLDEILSVERITHLRVPLTQRGLSKLFLELTALQKNEGICSLGIGDDPVSDPYLMDHEVGWAEWDDLSKQQREDFKLRLQRDQERRTARELVFKAQREEAERKRKAELASQYGVFPT